MSKRIAFLTAAEGVEEVELTKPWEAARQAGHTAELLSLDEGEVQLFHHLDKSRTQRIDRRVSDVSVADYDALVLPGGVANPDALRMDQTAVEFIRDHGISVVGSDNSAIEPIPFDKNVFLGVHIELLQQLGVTLIEHLWLADLAADECYDILLAVGGLLVVGATGSPVRPLAVVTRG